MTKYKIIRKNTQLRSQRERGQALVLIALSLVVLIAAIGLATDGTLIYRAKQDLQRTLDSAALAAAYKLPNQTNASKAAYQFGRLHGYNFDPSGNKLTITFPVYDPPRKAVAVQGTADVNLAFMSIIGFHTVKLSAQGEAESAPMDIYLVLDMSESMTYDTYDTSKPNNGRPTPWPPVGWPYSDCKLPSNWVSQSDCIAKYCNWARVCDPLDKHIKPAAKYFVDQLDPVFDRVGLVVYHQFGVKIIDLSNNFTAVKTAIENINAFDYQGGDDYLCPNTSPAGCNKNTNIGDGIMFAHNGIASIGRMDAIWSMVLLTDGKANIYRSCSGCPPSCGGATCQTLHLCSECTQAEDWAINNAKDTWNRHETTIYTIAYGDTSNDPAYQATMKKVADWTDNGVYDGTTNNFWAAPDEAGLKTAMREIAQRIYSRLLK